MEEGAEGAGALACCDRCRASAKTGLQCRPLPRSVAFSKRSSTSATASRESCCAASSFPGLGPALHAHNTLAYCIRDFSDCSSSVAGISSHCDMFGL